ncbi:Protein of unknown function [Actinacidiphila alni]|uniref:DUF742 domain-containing protein n=1 Tax=Actinacidiphila alni TaxID=380248 RepID=A0A1I2LD42_9ACTN|nr:DUF742 domain-containing protein [Actinacidiphila alni]SFF75091.1 Protein of unknown function [Actinacidiphila alni]
MAVPTSRNPAAVAEPIPREPRTYAITRGRVQTTRDLRLEAQLVPGRHTARRPVSAEEAQILAACSIRSISVAEAAHTIGRPVWAARVLVSDLLDTGALAMPAAAPAPGRDPAVLRRVLAGLDALDRQP